MKVIQLYNNYRSGGGGETRVVRDTEELLREHGHEVLTIERDSRDIQSWRDKLAASVRGVYSFQSRRQIARLLHQEQPDIVHVHNLYPLFSPSVLHACRQYNVPVVMTIHNHGLTCPTLNHFRDGELCYKCLGGREYMCTVHNCRGKLVESLSYSVRSTFARKARLFLDNVDAFIAISSFLKQQLIDGGYPADRIVVINNGCTVPEQMANPATGTHVAYAGGLNREKGIDTLLAAARRLPEIPVRLAGTGPEFADLQSRSPPNASMLGWLDRAALADVYRNARCLVVPSIWNEPFGLVVIEGMSHGLPVIASDRGAFPELIDDGIDGLLFKAGDAEDLAAKIRMLWNDPELARRLGQAARRKAASSFSRAVIFPRLLQLYEQVIRARRSHGATPSERNRASRRRSYESAPRIAAASQAAPEPISFCDTSAASKHSS